MKKIRPFRVVLVVVIVVILLYLSVSKFGNNDLFTTQSSNTDMGVEVKYGYAPLASVIYKFTNYGTNTVTSLNFKGDAPTNLKFDGEGKLNTVVKNSNIDIGGGEQEAYMKFYSKSNNGCRSEENPHPMNEGTYQQGSWILDDINIKPGETCSYAVTLSGNVGDLDHNNAIISADIVDTIPSESIGTHEQKANNHSEYKISNESEYFMSKGKVISIEKEMYFHEQSSTGGNSPKGNNEGWGDISSSNNVVNNICRIGDEISIKIKVRSHGTEDVKNLVIQDVLDKGLSYINGSLILSNGPSRCPNPVSYSDNKIQLDGILPNPYGVEKGYSYIDSVYGQPCIYEIRAKFKNDTVGVLLNNARLLQINNTKDPSDIIYGRSSSSDALKCSTTTEPAGNILFEKEVRYGDTSDTDTYTKKEENSQGIIIINDYDYIQYRLHIVNNTDSDIKEYEIRDTYIPWNFAGANDNGDSIDTKYDNISVPDGCDIQGKFGDIGMGGMPLWPDQYVVGAKSYIISCKTLKSGESKDIIFGYKKPIKLAAHIPALILENMAGFNYNFNIPSSGALSSAWSRNPPILGDKISLKVITNNLTDRNTR